MESTPITLDVQLAEEDFHALLDNIRMAERRWLRIPRVHLVVGWIALTALFAAAYLKRALHAPSLLIGIGLFWAGSAWLRKRCMKQAVPSTNSPFFLKQRYVFGDDGFTMSTAQHEATIKWPYVTEVRETPKHILLMAGNLDAFVLPKRFFASPAQESDLKQLAAARVAPPN